MPKISENEMQQNKARIVRTLLAHPHGLTANELMDLLGYDVLRTLNKHLEELRAEHRIYKEATLHFAFPLKEPRRFQPSPEEAVILYLAARLFVKHNHTQIKLADLTLIKMAEIVAEDMYLGKHILQAAHELANRPEAREYQAIFETMIRAYIHQRRVHITYEPYQGNSFETDFEPYLLEPSAIGFTTYAIGYSEIVDDLRTYKIERIRDIEMLNDEEFDVPADFPGLEILRNAWSIFFGDETVEVVMRFHPEVVRRVKETRWHPSQALQEDTEKPGYLLMQIEVSDTTDLKPWIRGWGAHCEVLKPDDLRQQLMGEARRLAELYGWYTTRNREIDEDDPLGLNDTFSDYFGK
ncbi:MAG: WYL domain-containing protein [Chloroflexi bacterium]|nr:WYL domain-containing protein [Chloroflexota bacterium]